MSYLSPLLDRCISKPSVPLMLVGDPGSGKTSQVESWAKSRGLPMVKLLVSTMDETDVAGLVVRDDDHAKVISPGWIKQLQGRGVLFLDEYNCGRKEVVDTLLTLICSRHLPNGDKLGDGVLIIAAMNDAEQCDNYELSPAMRSRFMQIEHKLPMSQWLQFTLTGATESETEDEQGLLPSYETQENWHKRFISDAAIEKDKKELLSEAVIKGLKFDSGDEFNEHETPTCSRSLFNLLYWCKNASEIQQWSSAFVSDEASNVFRSITVQSVRDTANAVFGTGVVGAGDAEDARLSSRRETLEKIQGAVNGASLD